MRVLSWLFEFLGTLNQPDTPPIFNPSNTRFGYYSYKFRWIYRYKLLFWSLI